MSERSQSQTAHRDASEDEAARLARESFGGILTAGEFDIAELASGEAVVRFLDDHTLGVDRPGTSADVLIDSPLPLRAENEQGVDRPVDLDVEPRGDGFAAANPLVDVQLPGRIEDGVTVGGVDFDVETGAGAASASAQSVDAVGGLLYHEAGADTDVVLAPVATGVEVAWQLRSPQAADEQRLRFELPAGGELVSAPDGGIDIVDGDTRIGRVLPPYAVDAQGRAVDVSYETNGATLVVRAEHRDKDVAYPILVDPVVEDWLGPSQTNSWYHGYNYNGISHWFWQTNQAAYGQPYAPRTDCYVPVSCYKPAGMPVPPYGRGLYVYVFPGPQQVPGGTFGEWLYDPPGSTTQVTQATLGPNFSQRRSADLSPYFFLGIWAEGLNDWTALSGYPTMDVSGVYTTLNAGSHLPNSGANQIAVGYFAPGTVTLPTWRDFGVGGARITMTDPENPAVSAVGLSGPSGWVSSGSYTVAPTATDPGLGVKSLMLSVPKTGGTATQTRTHACTGVKASPCPASWTLPQGATTAFGFTVADGDPNVAGNQPMPEGVNTIGVVAKDALLKSSTSATTTVKVDRGAPSLALSGTLWGEREAVPPPTPGVPMAEGAYELTAEATDPAAGPAPQGTRAGVERIEVKVDGQSVDVDAGACAPGNCPRTLGWELDTAAYDPGRHTVQVIATDGAGNATTREFTVFVPEPPPVAPPLSEVDVTPFVEATEFLYTGLDPVQTGVAPGTIEARRAAVIRGAVRSTAGAPLAGVSVSAPGHPEYGATTTDADGEFNYAVNGGSQTTIRIEKSGHLPVDRQVDVPWQDYVWADDVVLTPLDPNENEIDLSLPLSPLQVARGSAITDADGARQATLIFQPDTAAEMTLPNGTTAPLDELTVRATEYTVGDRGPDAMPAELPPTSAYTYAAEFSVDEAVAAGATDVQFSRPVASYTENFLDFPVGQTVPAGYYDRQVGSWVAGTDGRVVEVLSEAGGEAVLDVSGAGNPASPTELDELGVTEEELAELADLYAPGDTLWRVGISHFTPWDLNWPFWIPDDWTAPDGKLPPRDIDEPCRCSGSVIETESQTLGEDLSLVGSDLGLHYRSDRVSGRIAARKVDIPLVGATVPAGLDKVNLFVQVAGQRFTQQFEPTPNLEYTYEWDGLDAFGRRVNGSQKAAISISYTYDSTRYGVPANGGASFGRRPDAWLTSTNARITKGESQGLEVVLGGYERPRAELGGWTLTNHHHYDPLGQVLHMGDGRRRRAVNVGMTADVVAGNPGSGNPTLMSFGSGSVDLANPVGVAVAADGIVYFTDAGNAVIRRIALDGSMTTIAGDPEERREFGEPGGDDGPASAATFASLEGIDVARDGSIYVVDLNRIRRIAPDGTISTFAGREDDPGDPSFSGDGGPAVDATFDEPRGLEVASDGSLYIADYRNHRIRRVGTDGVITTVAGSGPVGYDQGDFAGDGAAAVDARLSEPTDVAVAASGDLFVADEGNARVRRVTDDGRIETVAGDGGDSETEYGEDATASSVVPSGLAIDDQDRLLISNFGAIARLDRDGAVRKVAGTSDCAGFSCNGAGGDGAPADRANLGCPVGLAQGQRGDIYLTDPCLDVVRRVRPSLPGFDATEQAIPSPDGDEIFQFDDRGRHLSTRDAATGALLESFSYDGEGRLISIEDADGLETEIDRDVAGMPVAIVAPFGQRTELARDGDGYLEGVENPADEETVFDYAPGGLLASFTTPEGNETTFEHDADGRLTLDSDAAGGFQELTRTKRSAGSEVELETKLGRTSGYEVERLADDSVRRTQTDPAGFARTTVDEKDGATIVEEPDGTTRRYEIGGDPRFGAQAPFVSASEIETPGGRLAEWRASRDIDLTDPEDPLSVESITERTSLNYEQTIVDFDVAAGLIEVETPEGRSATTEVDALRRPMSTTMPGITPVVYSRDALGRVEEVSQGVRATAFDYDASGRLETVTDALAREHGFAYDGADRVVEETLPDGREIVFGYDDDGNLASVTPPSRPAHAFGHTALGQTGNYTPPDLGSGPQPTTFGWSDDRELTQIAKPGGRTVDFDYDAGGRLEEVAHSGGATTFSYNSGTGRLASATAAGGEQTAFAWDGFLPLGETVSGTVDGEVSRTFDDDLRLASESVNGTDTAPYYYDDDGLLIQAGEVSIYRDPSNGLLTSTSHGAITTAVERDAFGDPELVSSRIWPDILYEEEYERDDLGRIVEKVERRGVQATTYEYAYDVGGRLETVTKDGLLAATYSYDANGNRVGVDRAGELPVVGVYDAQDRLTDYGSAEYDHDASGQLTSKVDGADTTTYDYGDLGALRGVTLPNGDEIDYAIDAQGRRIAKKVDGTLTQGFLYGQGLGPVAELDGAGDVVSRFVYATRANVPEYMVRGGQTYRILVDQLGSPRAVVDVSTGVVEQRMDFDEFGRVTADTNPGFQPFGFAGGLYDRDTGLVRFGARDYDPEAGRWTAKDPIGFDGGDANLYGYVLGDPVNLIDPRGLLGLPGFVEDGFSAVADVVDHVTPDPVSEFSAGVFDGALFGLPSRGFGVDGSCWGTAHLLGGVFAPGPGKFAKGFQRLGISKTVRVDRRGKPIPPRQSYKTSIGDAGEALRNAGRLLEKESHVDGASRGKNLRNVADALEQVGDALRSIGGG